MRTVDPVDVSTGATIRSVVGLSVLIVVFALCLRLLFFGGYQGRDDRNYLAYAGFVNSGNSVSSLNVQTQWVGRIGFWVPLAGSMRLLGNSQIGYTAYSLLCSLVGVGVTIAIGRITVGHAPALLAALGVATMPLDALYATRAYADLPVGMFMVMALWLMLESRRTPSRAVPCLAGLALGFAYLNKETAVFAMAPMVLIVKPWSRQQWRQLAWFGVGFVAVLAAETAFWTVVKGDALYRFHAAGSALQQVLNRQQPPASLPFGLIPGPRPDEAYRSSNSLVDAALMLTTNEEFALNYWLGLPVLLLLTLRRHEPTRELRIWVMALLPLFLFFPVHWPRYTMPRDPRYFVCLTIPLMLVLASYLVRLRPAVRHAVVVLILLTNLAGMFIGRESSRMDLQEMLLKAHDAHPGRLWVTPQLGADILILGGIARGGRLGLHLIEQGRASASFQAVQLIAPTIPVAEHPNEIRDGILVLRARNMNRAPDGWRIAERLDATPSRPITLLQSALRKMNLPTLARRLSPGGGESIVLYRPSGPAVSAGSASVDSTVAEKRQPDTSPIQGVAPVIRAAVLADDVIDPPAKPADRIRETARYASYLVAFRQQQVAGASFEQCAVAIRQQCFPPATVVTSDVAARPRDRRLQ
jgi:hypothetical protein